MLFNEWLLQERLKEDISATIDDVNLEIRQTAEWLISEPHYGDCTKQNVTCKICLFEMELNDYYKYTKSQGQ